MNMWTFLVVCASVWALFQILAVLVGWRFTKMRPAISAAVEARDEAITGWQACGRKDGDDWDYEDIEALAAVLQKACDEEPDPTAEHFVLWRQEVTGSRAVRRRLKRMERSDR